jgi:hypothetical protein
MNYEETYIFPFVETTLTVDKMAIFRSIYQGIKESSGDVGM